MHPAVVQACFTILGMSGYQKSHGRSRPSTSGGGRQSPLLEQVALHIAGYRDHDEFTRDGCLFAWNVFETPHLATHRDH